MFIEITPYGYQQGSKADSLKTVDSIIINTDIIVSIDAEAFGCRILYKRGKDLNTFSVAERYEEISRLLNVSKVIDY